MNDEEQHYFNKVIEYCSIKILDILDYKNIDKIKIRGELERVLLNKTIEKNEKKRKRKRKQIIVRPPLLISDSSSDE